MKIPIKAYKVSFGETDEEGEVVWWQDRCVLAETADRAIEVARSTFPKEQQGKRIYYAVAVELLVEGFDDEKLS